MTESRVVEGWLGLGMVKYVRSIEFVKDYQDIGPDLRGWCGGNQFYDTGAGI